MDRNVIMLIGWCGWRCWLVWVEVLVGVGGGVGWCG